MYLFFQFKFHVQKQWRGHSKFTKILVNLLLSSYGETCGVWLQEIKRQKCLIIWLCRCYPSLAPNFYSRCKLLGIGIVWFIFRWFVLFLVLPVSKIGWLEVCLRLRDLKLSLSTMLCKQVGTPLSPGELFEELHLGLVSLCMWLWKTSS